MMSFYFPVAKAQKIDWCKNLSVNLGIEGPKINESATEIANVQADCQAIVDINQQVDDARNMLQRLIATRDEVENAAGKRIRDYIKRLKTNPLYTMVLGKLLGILSTLVSEDLTTIKLVLKAVVTGRHIRISFGKKHNVDAMNVYRRIGGAGDFAFLAMATKSPFLDEQLAATTGVPTLYEYYAMPVSNNKEVGQASDIVAVHFKG